MRFFVLALTVSFGLGCAGSSREARSPEDGSEEEAEPPSEEAEQPAEAEEGDGEEQQSESRPAKKRRPKRRRHVQAAPEPEPAPIARAPKPQPQPVAPPPEEPTSVVYGDGTDQGNDLEGEARKRCHWKKVPPYRPEWANSISPPLSRKITSKPICPYGTPPAVVRVARQIAAQQPNLNKR